MELEEDREVVRVAVRCNSGGSDLEGALLREAGWEGAPPSSAGQWPDWDPAGSA